MTEATRHFGARVKELREQLQHGRHLHGEGAWDVSKFIDEAT